MRSLCFYLIVGSLLMSCQSNTNSNKEKNEKSKQASKKPVTQKIIEDTYNATAYQQKNIVAVDVLWVNQDSTTLQFFMKPDATLHIVKKDAVNLYLSGDQSYKDPGATFSQDEVDIYKQIINILQLPYRLDDYKISSSADSLRLNKQTTLTRSYHLQGQNNISIYPHQRTDLIKAVKFTDRQPVDIFVLDKYITVKKIPICMDIQYFKSTINDQSPRHSFEIRRISYPEDVFIDFTIPDNAQPIQNL